MQAVGMSARSLGIFVLTSLALACEKLPMTMPWSQAAEADAGVADDNGPDIHKLKVLRDGVQVLSIKLGELSKKVRGEQPRVDDALEGNPVVYEGVHLAALLDTLIGPDWVRADHVRLRFQNGGSADILPARLLARKSWLVWKRTDRPDFVVMQSGRAVPLGPLYLVWETGIDSGIMPGMTDPDTWVHGIVSLDIVATPAPAVVVFALPVDATPGDRAGFGHYQNYCAHCHTLGGVGAGSGPELLRPVPVTQIWRPGFLERYLDDPTTVRLRANGPKLPTDAANRRQIIGDIVAFLHAAARSPVPTQEPAAATPSN